MRPMVSCRTAWFLLATLAWMKPAGRVVGPSFGVAAAPRFRGTHRLGRPIGRRGRVPACPRIRASEELAGRDPCIYRCDGDLAKSHGFQSSSSALRDPLQAGPPLPGPELPQRSAPAPQGKVVSTLRRVARADRVPLCRSGPIRALAARGYDNLEVALRDPEFLRTNASSTDPDRIKWLRNALSARRAQVSSADRTGAQSEVLAACELAAKAASPQRVLGDPRVHLWRMRLLG